MEKGQESGRGGVMEGERDFRKGYGIRVEVAQLLTHLTIKINQDVKSVLEPGAVGVV